MPTYDSDKPMTVLGVPGRLTHRTTRDASHDPKPDCWFKQRWISEPRDIAGYGPGARIAVEMRFDDECGNGHNTFAITASIYQMVVDRRRRRDDIAAGCLHEDIATAFPEFAPLIPWHLTSADGPMHYIANTVYFAGNRDHHGRLKGEPRQWETVIQFGDNPIKHRYPKGFMDFLQAARPLHGQSAFDFEVLPIYHDDQGKPGKHQFGPKFTFGGYADKWHECPFDTETYALDFLCALQLHDPRFVSIVTAWGEGKERELDTARRAAVWPEATDAELSVERDNLKAALAARLPDLLARFRADMERIGFVWSPKEMATAQA